MNKREKFYLDKIVSHENFEMFFYELSFVSEKYFNKIFNETKFRLDWDFWDLKGEVNLYISAKKIPALKKFFTNCYPNWVDPFGLRYEDLLYALDNYNQRDFSKLITDGKINLFEHFLTCCIDEVDHKAKYGC